MNEEKAKALAGAVLMIGGVIMAGPLVPIPFLPHILLGLAGGYIIEDMTYVLIVLFGAAFFVFVSAFAVWSPSSGHALINMGIGILNTMGLIVGCLIGAYLAHDNETELMSVDDPRRNM